jgi:hypothetical protein
LLLCTSVASDVAVLLCAAVARTWFDVGSIADEWTKGGGRGTRSKAARASRMERWKGLVPSCCATGSGRKDDECSGTREIGGDEASSGAEWNERSLAEGKERRRRLSLSAGAEVNELKECDD